jgi:hypothetical protein
VEPKGVGTCWQAVGSDNREEHRALPERREGSTGCYTKKGDPSGIRTEAKRRETARGFAVSVGDGRSEIIENRVVTLSGSKVARMAAVAANAVRNCDLSRAIEVLEELRRMSGGRSG